MADDPAPVEKLTLPDTQQVSSPVVQNEPPPSFGMPPQMTAGLTWREVGVTGLRQFAGWVREEFLPQLVGRQAARVYREMGDNSPVIGGILMAINATMRKVEWRVQPPDDMENNPEAKERVDFIESCMHDMSHTWSEGINENLSMLQYGFAPHELVYKRRLGRRPGADPGRPGRTLPGSKYDDGLVGWRRIPIRGQDTVIKWFFDENGTTKGVTQQPYVGPLTDIPIEKMLLFRPTAMKGNPEGRSIIRNSYVSWYYVKRLEQQEAITYERLGGLPVVRCPPQLLEAAKSGDAESVALVESLKKISRNVRIDEQMGILLPSTVYEGANGPSQVYQYNIEFLAPQGARGAGVSPDVAIQRHSVNMMISVLADFLMMGHEVRGTQGLSTNKVDLFFQAIEGFLNSIGDVYSRFGVPRLFDLNGWDQKLAPKIVPDLAQRIDLDVLSNFVLRLSQAGMPLFPNDELQSYLADAAGLPDVQDPLAMEAAGLTPDLIGHETDLTLNPPDPGARRLPGAKAPPPDIANTPLGKMLLASLARRVIKMQGPRFGIGKRPHGRNTRARRIANYGSL